MGTTARIFKIHCLLRQGKPIPLRALEQELEVSKATVKRDLDLLRDQLGAPIRYERPKGYIYDPQAPEFELPGLWFNESELHGLLASEQILEAIQPGVLSPRIAPLKQRIRSLLEKTGHPSSTVNSRIVLQPAAHRVMDSDRFGIIAGAVLDSKVLDIEYHGRERGHVTLRRIHPHRLLRYRDNWYLVAWCERAAAIRTFSLDRMRHCKIADAPMRVIDDAALQHYLMAGFGIFAGEPSAWAELRFSPRIARWVADEQWHPDQEGTWQQGYYFLKIPYCNSRELIMDILKYGPEVQVIGPKALRDEVVARLTETLQKYS